MAYSKTTWANGTTPAINADNLNKIEQGIDDAHENLDILTDILNDNFDGWNKHAFLWEHGKINVSGTYAGKDANSTTQARTPSYYTFDKNDIIKCPKGLAVQAFKYSYNASTYKYDYVSADTEVIGNNYVIEDDEYFYRFVYRKEDNATLLDLIDGDNVLAYVQNIIKHTFEKDARDNGANTLYSCGSLPDTADGTMSTSWYIPLDCVVPKNAYIKSITIKSATAKFAGFQVALFRRQANSANDNFFMICLKKIDILTYMSQGENEFYIGEKTHSQTYIGIRPLYANTFQYSRTANEYGYYTFAESAWETDPYRLSYSNGYAFECIVSDAIRQKISALKVNYYFKATPFVGKKIAIIGDSIQTETMRRSYYNWYELLGSEYGFVYVPWAKGGRAYDPAVAGDVGMANYVSSVYTQYYKPDAIVFFAGTNDYGGSHKPLGNLESEMNYNTIYGCIRRAFYEAINNFPYTPILAISPTPRGVLVDEVVENCLNIENDYGYTLKDIVTAIRSLSLEYQLYFFNATERSPLNPCMEGAANKFYNGDYLHPTLKGHTVIAAQVREAIAQLFSTSYDKANDYFSSPYSDMVDYNEI